MRKIIVCSILLMLVSHLVAQETSSAPQTAREALMEMFFSKTKGTFWKHLPEVTRAALEKAGAMDAFHQYSTMMTQVQSSQNLQTFETGSVMVAGVDPKTGNKFEMIVERDTLRGDRDDIEVSFRGYKDGQPQRAPFMPNVTFSMKKEAQLWTLNEVSITIHLPLADPDMLKALTEKMQWRPEMHVQTTLDNGASADRPKTVLTTGNVPADTNSDAQESQVISAMRTIITAEKFYASAYAEVGYTCTLSNLDGFGAGDPGPHQAMLISSSLAGGRRYGYIFTLSGCTGAPAGRFFLTAIPNEPGFGRKVFCGDVSGVIRSTDESGANSCLTNGSPIQ